MMLSYDICDIEAVTHSIITGRVKSVIMLLNAVKVTDNATSPFISMENTFDELPPGHHATDVLPLPRIQQVHNGCNPSPDKCCKQL